MGSSSLTWAFEVLAYVLRVVRLGLPLLDVPAGALVEACLLRGIVGFCLA